MLHTCPQAYHEKGYAVVKISSLGLLVGGFIDCRTLRDRPGMFLPSLASLSLCYLLVARRFLFLFRLVLSTSVTLLAFRVRSGEDGEGSLARVRYLLTYVLRLSTCCR